jgi:hypothetical protein
MLFQLYEHLKLPETVYIPLIGKYWYSILCRLENRYIRRTKLPEWALNKEPRKERVIVSLTSFPARINSTHLAIKSLMLQSYKPDEIILWLSEKQFENCKIPDSIMKLKKNGLQIRYCDDLRGHKKYFNLIKNQQPDELILTYDDDIIYPPDSISKVMKYHEKYPDAIITNRGYEMIFSEDGKLKPHLEWKINSKYSVGKPEKLVFVSTGSGVLYPYKALHSEVLNAALIERYALGVDDIWITLMAIMHDTDIVKTTRYHKTYTTVSGSQEYQLALENVKREKNGVTIDKYDQTINELMTVYPELKKLLVLSRKNSYVKK